MDPINIPPMLAYIPAPWILWVWHWVYLTRGCVTHMLHFWQITHVWFLLGVNDGRYSDGVEHLGNGLFPLRIDILTGQTYLVAGCGYICLACLFSSGHDMDRL